MASSRARLFMLASATAITGAALVACPPLDFLYSRSDESGPEASVESGPPEDAGVEAGCRHARPPPPPPTPGTGGSQTIVFAIRSVVLTSKDRSLGWDLDLTCTCQDDGGGARSCKPPNADAGCDGLEGRDAISEELFSLAPEDPNASINSGARTTLFEVSGWSGAPNDDAVILVGYASNGIWATDPKGMEFIDDGGVLPDGGKARSLPPRWDGADKWTVDPSGAVEPIFATRAYIRDGFLVAKIDEPAVVPGVLVSPGILSAIDLHDAWITGRLVQQPSGLWAIEGGTIAGRAEARRLVGITVLKDGPDGGYECGEPTGAALLRPFICSKRDIRTRAADDGKDLPCDALSFGVGFTAGQAAKGLPRAPSLPVCSPVPADCP